MYNPQNIEYTSQNPTFYQSQPVPYSSNPQNVGYQTPYYYPYQATVITNPQTEAISSFPLYSGPPPNSYSILAWLTCLFCCWPCGLFAIVKSIEVNTAIAEGNLSRAKFASDNAKRYGFLSLRLGIFFHGAWILFLTLYLTVVLPKVNSVFKH
ncbi:proline-rich transmembrane protein 1 [Hydra vulgaris]|uniref:proline-rich transmembrane protein 1 n=1 Tax=Hydra vulgaris TaxID=6087 RepID=UPI001F5FE928|nr:proline-rich transmembrane protein 1-like [Hydra vulgaris]